MLGLAVASAAQAATYYVSSSGGSDSNNGLTEATAFATITKGLDTTTAGDTLLLKRGDTFIGTAGYVWSKGQESLGLTVGDYGTGAKPIWTLDASVNYYIEIFNCPNTLTVNNVRFQASGNRQYTAVRCFGAHTMTFNNCEFYKLSYGLRPACGANVVANNCYFEWVFWGAYLCYEDVNESTLTLNGCEVTGCLLGSLVKNEGGYVYIQNCKIHDITSTEVSDSSEAYNQPVCNPGLYYGNTMSITNNVFYNIPIATLRYIIQTKSAVSGVVTTCVHNTFYNNSTRVVNDRYTKDSGVTFTNNIIAGPSVTGDYGIVEADNSSYANVVEDYNLYYQLTGNFQINSVEQTLGVHSLTGQSPLFKSTDPASADFLKLSQTSPAYNKTAGWYMGAYDYVEDAIPVLAVSPASQSAANTTGTTSFSVSNTGTGTMAWTASVTSGSSWLTITSGTSGTNSGTIAVSFTANTTYDARTATITVTATGATGSPIAVTVVQAAKTRTPGDANLDSKVDVGDLGILAANYGITSGATWAKGDFNSDDKVDVGDLGILAANYGTNASGADFDADYAKVFGTATEDTEIDSTSTLCSSLGLSLIAGLLLAFGFVTTSKLND
jgi:hypothetical protein